MKYWFDYFLWRIYKIAMTQDQAVGVDFAFVVYIYILQAIHFLMIGLIFRLYGFELGEVSTAEYLCFAAVILGANYFVFIRFNYLYRAIEKFRGIKVKNGTFYFALYFALILAVIGFEINYFLSK